MRYLNDYEWKLASRFLFLSLALRVIKYDLEKLQQLSPFKINEIYIDLFQQVEQYAIKERRKLRQKMQQEKMQVMTLEKNESFTSYLFICKGKEETRNYFNPAIRKKVEQILKELVSQVTGLEKQQKIK
ncbi:hypothetical protein [Gracilibacillus sp. YIM 98692]|uniref:hypothetical protein n=1 Tax=Gracilibacillus sp. YIM 98692 TaxID=2663532 RepID=UPI0013D410AF|nr:hypothetical protein [Gracilibacillus sp. YIM 98692]